MAVRLFNTYSRALEEFRPLDPTGREVKMYTCGPTVYSHAHIGNFRAYLFEDLLQRHLESRGFEVRRVMNITDVDDKTIRGSREADVPLAEFTSQFKKAFFDDLDTLRIKRADSFPEATDPREIAKMIEMIGTLMERGLAYQAEDKSIYFRINKFPDYGKLAHFDLEELRSTGRVKSDEYDKEHIGDFALWKAWDEADGPVKWSSPWGDGRPGWHIECSAMATQLLGDQLDIHCGGVDNIFPHHEAEIAQTEGCTGKKFVRCWLHCAHLMVEGQKMAKSLGNFYTLRDVLAKGYSGREVRYALMRVHYRAPLNFTWEGMDEARQALGRIDDWVERLRVEASDTNKSKAPSSKLQAPEKHQAPKAESGFRQALDDDLNISGALGALFETIRETNRQMDAGETGAEEAKSWLEWWKGVDGVLQISGDEAELPAEIAELAEARVQARLAKDWRKSDELRDVLAARGWEARDTKDGQKITRRGGA
ncbi:MAG TPA: cysteine--tRNA ligase [Chthoniobacterales bacterium]|nr:cysteine--tRNA ligase [Chthoniobacterales bacterium]